MTKILNKVKIEGSDCNIIKVIYEKSISNIIVINEKLKTSKITRPSAGSLFPCRASRSSLFPRKNIWNV